jgi:hypothetical protein
MLLEFDFSNFRSFAENAKLSLVATNYDRSNRDTLISVSGGYVSKTAAIFGPNASGKSNVLNALQFLISFVNRSIRMNSGEPIADATPFRLDPIATNQPCAFKIHFVSNEHRFVYEVSMTYKEVHFESLTRCYAKHDSVIFERRLKAKRYTWKFEGIPAQIATYLQELTRPNGLVLSKGAEMQVGPIVEAFSWFRERVQSVDAPGSAATIYSSYVTAGMCKDKRWKSHIQDLIRSADFGISGLNVTELALDIADAPPEIKAMFTEHGLKKLAQEKRQVMMADHAARDGSLVRFNWADESNGTVRFFSLIGPFLRILANGGLAIIDELDYSLHPDLSRKIVEMFHSRTFNVANAQLIFTTHDTSLMDQTLFRRDQIWLTEKSTAGASQLFSLYDFEHKPRKGEAIERRYRAGKYGAIPRFDPVLHDILSYTATDAPTKAHTKS